MAIWIYRRQCRWFVGLEDGVEDVSVLILEDSVEAGFVAGVEYGLVEGSIAVVSDPRSRRRVPASSIMLQLFDWNSRFSKLCLH